MGIILTEQCTIETLGVVLTDAYLCILGRSGNINITKIDGTYRIQYMYEVWANKATRLLEDTFPVTRSEISFTVTPLPGNVSTAAYDHLKTIYPNCIDDV